MAANRGNLVDIFSVRADGSDLQRHTRCRSECSYPSVSPDGKRLLYRRVIWTAGADGAPVRNSEIATANLDGGNEQNLSNSPAYDVYPIWSHDGRWIYFSSQRPAPSSIMHVWRLSALGGAAECVSTGDWGHRQGSKIYVFAFARANGAEVGHIAPRDRCTTIAPNASGGIGPIQAAALAPPPRISPQAVLGIN